MMHRNNNLLGDVVANEGSIRKRVKRGSVFNKVVPGHKSPILPMESMIVATIVYMVRIRQCLTPSQGLNLII